MKQKTGAVSTDEKEALHIAKVMKQNSIDPLALYFDREYSVASSPYIQ